MARRTTEANENLCPNTGAIAPIMGFEGRKKTELRRAGRRQHAKLTGGEKESSAGKGTAIKRKNLASLAKKAESRSKHLARQIFAPVCKGWRREENPMAKKKERGKKERPLRVSFNRSNTSVASERTAKEAKIAMP